MRHLVRLLVMAALLSSMGCRASLGECDESAINNTIVYRANVEGTAVQPYYAGQALMTFSCAGSVCHSETTPTVEDKQGAPGGFHLGLQPYSVEACGDDPTSAACNAEYVRLTTNQEISHVYARLSWSEVEEGRMPPNEPSSQTPFYYTYNNGVLSDPLPGLADPESRDMLRNWLRCGSPVISLTPVTEDSAQIGRECEDSVAFGVCVNAGPPPAAPDPDWDSIYAFFERSGCDNAACHGEETPPLFTSADDAYAALVGVDASAGECGTDVLVIEGNADDSILYQKLVATEDDPPPCGDHMPAARTSPFPSDILDPIRQWINDGAQR